MTTVHISQPHEKDNIDTWDPHIFSLKSYNSFNSFVKQQGVHNKDDNDTTYAGDRTEIPRKDSLVDDLCQLAQLTCRP